MLQQNLRIAGKLTKILTWSLLNTNLTLTLQHAQ